MTSIYCRLFKAGVVSVVKMVFGAIPPEPGLIPKDFSSNVLIKEFEELYLSTLTNPCITEIGKRCKFHYR